MATKILKVGLLAMSLAFGHAGSARADGLVAPADPAATPEPICGVCRILTEGRTQKDASTIEAPPPSVHLRSIDGGSASIAQVVTEEGIRQGEVVDLVLVGTDRHGRDVMKLTLLIGGREESLLVTPAGDPTAAPPGGGGGGGDIPPEFIIIEPWEHDDPDSPSPDSPDDDGGTTGGGDDGGGDDGGDTGGEAPDPNE